MKGNNGKGNNSERDAWRTPEWLFDTLNDQYCFAFDCCADEQNKKCPSYSDNFENVVEPMSPAWMNAPFSIASRMFAHFFKVVRCGVAIYRCDNLETYIWQLVILPNASWVFVFDERIEYDGMTGNGVRFPSALIGIGVNPPTGLNGTTLRIAHADTTKTK